MDYNTETVNVQYINNAFLDKIEEGLTKEASAAMGNFVRQKLREEGFTRKILTPVMINAADIDRDTTDQPSVIVEKEPDSVAANIDLNGRSEVRYFRGSRYRVGFAKIESAEFTKSKYELATYKTDIRQILQENSVKDIQKAEDENFVTALGQIFSTRSGEFTGENANTKYLTDTTLNGARITDKVMQMLQLLVDDFQKPGKVLMSHQLYLAMLREPATQLGDSVASEHFKTGNMDDFYGFQIVTSIKSDVLSTDFLDGNEITRANKGNLVVVFAPEEYLGQFYSLQEPTVYLKAEADMISFRTYESVGIGIGNTKAFIIGKIDPRLR